MVHINQMPIATKENKLDISSEKKIEEAAKQIKPALIVLLALLLSLPGLPSA